MIYQTASIQESGGVSFSGEVSGFEEISREVYDSRTDLNKPLKAEFEISIGSKEYLLLGETSGNFRLTCSRCAELFNLRFRQELEETYPLSVEEIDAGEQIRQAVVLALPDKPLCRKDCKGLCPVCGVNRNISACSCRPPAPGPFAKLKDIYKRG
ncbi:MAG: DUF177 domain-containing protein [Elusimicrobiota bacterium]